MVNAVYALLYVVGTLLALYVTLRVCRVAFAFIKTLLDVGEEKLIERLKGDEEDEEICGRVEENE